jgi:[ribosomal protein S5]-alanine N-acetyltransferase
MLRTRRLLIAPLQKSDAHQVIRFFRDPEVSCLNVAIPQTLVVEEIENWIEGLGDDREIFTIRRTGHDRLVGVACLLLKGDTGVAEYTYTIGVPYRGKRYGSEASKALFDYGFQHLNLTRIYTTSLSTTLNFGKALEKVGMMYEGCLRQHVNYWGQWQDLHFHGILRQQYMSAG